MALIKSAGDIAHLREAGKRLAHVLDQVGALVAPGVNTAALDQQAEELIRAGGDTPAFLGYQPRGAERPYPATLCVSINDEIVHGIPTEDAQILKEGDIVGLDIGLVHNGLVVDMARTYPVGTIDQAAVELIDVTKQALTTAIHAAQGGARLGDIGHAIKTLVAPYGYGIVEELGGHGVGHAVHEEPYIPNVGIPGKGTVLKPGMVLALEPMLSEGSKYVTLAPDGYTFKTADGSRSAHFEHTILITEAHAEILTHAA